MEQAGTNLKSLLVRSNPWARGKCGKGGCLPCEAVKIGSNIEKSRCGKRNILYESSCVECLEEGKEATYVGDSSISEFQRAEDHVKDYRTRQEEGSNNIHLFCGADWKW